MQTLYIVHNIKINDIPLDKNALGEINLLCNEIVK